MSVAARPAPPRWMALSASLVRRLPAARYRAMSLIGRVRTPPFVAELPGQGLRFECDLRNALAREVFFTGQYEPQETCLVKALLEPGHTFLDVGAHWGYFSFLAARRVGPAGRVLSVEADPRIFHILERNAALNGLPNLTLVQAAAAAAEGTLTLSGYSEEEENWGTSRVVDRPAAGGAAPLFEVRARPLDALLDEQGVRAVDLVKMDIEGAEGFALAGMREGLARGRYRRLLLELHPVQLREHGMDAREVVERLLEAGYRGFRVDHSPEATRRAAYASDLRPSDFLSALDASAPLDAWPHVLWVAPGEAPPVPGVT